MKTLIIAFLLCFCYGCTTIEKIVTKKIDREFVISEFKPFYKSFHASDNYYHVVKDEQIEEIIWVWNRRLKKEYIPELNDCDDFVDRFIRDSKDYAFDKWRINLAVFRIVFKDTDKYKDGHSIVCIFDYRKKKKYFESITGKIIDLPKNIEIYFIK